MATFLVPVPILPFPRSNLLMFLLFPCALAGAAKRRGKSPTKEPLETHPTFPGPSSKKTSRFVIFLHRCVTITGCLVLWFLVFLRLLSPRSTAALLLFQGLVQQFWDQTCCPVVSVLARLLAAPLCSSRRLGLGSRRQSQRFLVSTESF